MLWPQRGSSVRLGGAELRSDAGRCALIAACALIAVCRRAPARRQRRTVRPPDTPRTPGYGGEQRAEELYLDGIEKLEAGHRDFARDTFEQVIARYPVERRRPTTRAASSASSIATIFARRRVLVDSYDARAPRSPSRRPRPPARSPRRRLRHDRVARRRAARRSVLGSWSCAATHPSNPSSASRRAIACSSRPAAPSSAAAPASALAAQAQWLKRWHEFEAAIEGHADEPGTEQENVVLSEQRAEAVRQRLIEEGVEPSRLAVVPLGRSIRVATCADTDCRAQNRRAVTLVFATGTRERLGLVVQRLRARRIGRAGDASATGGSEPSSRPRGAAGGRDALTSSA